MPQRRVTDNNVIVDQIDDFVRQNSLDPIERLMLRVMKHNYINSVSVCKHVDDKEIHTPKGLLVRAGVISCFIFIMILVSTLVMYVPDGLALLRMR